MAESSEKTSNDLSDLLDSALKDFDAPTSAAKTKEDKSAEKTDDAAEDPDAFFVEQAKILADRMNTIFSNPTETAANADLAAQLPQDTEQIMTSFKKMAEAAAITLQGDNPADAEEVAKYSNTIAQALKGLQEGSESLAAPISENDVASMFGGLNDADGSDGNAFLPFMEGMMQSLLSAEILLPSIKELLEKYPVYLQEHGSEISAEDKQRYENQLELYKVIEGHLEAENANDSAAVKREKFKLVLEDMRKLQEYGQPPQEILAETAPDIPFEQAAAAGMNPQCPMM